MSIFSCHFLSTQFDTHLSGDTLAKQNNTLYCSIESNSVEYEILVIGEEIVVRHTTICCCSDHCCTISSLKVGFSSLVVPAITERRSAAVIENVQHFEILNIKAKITFIIDTIRFKVLNKSCIIEKNCVFVHMKFQFLSIHIFSIISFSCMYF
jgi:hypothetical protein